MSFVTITRAYITRIIDGTFREMEDGKGFGQETTLLA